MLNLFAIEDVFDITGRGCVLAPGIPHSLGLNIRIGAHLLIVSPFGGRIRTQISSFEMLHTRTHGLSHAPFAVSSEIKKEQLELGSKVFLIEESGI